MILRGRTIGGYTVCSRIGGGRYGVCYLAEDPSGGQVVLKRFRRRMFRKNREKNHHEAVILSSLEHPAIPALLGVLNHRLGYFFVLEYQPGVSLEQLLFRQKHVFTDQEILRIGSQLWEVLCYLHRLGIVHRDISIANVLDDGAHISLLDFGLARRMDMVPPSETVSPALDYACIGNLLLYLLYSGRRSKPGTGREPWYRQLPLPAAQIHYLKRLLGLEPAFLTTEEAAGQFRECFGGFSCSQ